LIARILVLSHLFQKFLSSSSNNMTESSSSIQVKVLFFASAREAAGATETQVLLPATHATTTALRQRLANDYPSLSGMVLDEDSITLALNEEYVGAGQVLDLKSGDCVALIPPISGG
jgi:molybdopterin synthase sulfur carrier subunit